MRRNHTSVARAERARGVDELAAAERQAFGAHHARRFHPARETDEDNQQRHRWLKHRGGDHQERQPRHGDHGVGDPHQEIVDYAAGVARDASDRHARRTGDCRRQESDGERHARAIEDAREHVAAEIVSAEPVRARRWFAPMRKIEALGRIGRDDRRRASRTARTTRARFTPSPVGCAVPRRRQREHSAAPRPSTSASGAPSGSCNRGARALR